MKQWINTLSVMLLLALASQFSHAAQTYGSFKDLFGAAGLDSNWKSVDPNSAVAIVDEAAAIPSNDGKVLELDASQVLLAGGTEDWKSVTVSASILPVQADLSIQGVIAAMGNGFTCAKTDSYFAATFLRANGQSILRLWLNGGDVNLDFPGAAIGDVAPPGNPFDGNYHKITLKVNRDGTSPLLTLLWDDVAVTHFGPDAMWSARARIGRAGVISWFRAPGDKTRYDNFQATWDDAPAAPAFLGNQFTDKFATALDASSV